METASCMELALEGERLCKAGNCRTGAQYFEEALQVGTDDLQVLSAIYSQLGNAYFYLQDYGRALEYHRHDLNITRTLRDQLGEAKASGNLGNTLKVLGKFDEAVLCCQRHLDISRQLADKVGEARALYNLGNVYHARAKHTGPERHDPGEFPPEVAENLHKAAHYYQKNLELVRQLGDRAAQGRACGNLGNTQYLLGNFTQAVEYHRERLAIAKEFGDKAAERRAYSNLGNAHIFLSEFETAAQYYLRTLELARVLQDRALEAQACYSLGNTYTLLLEYAKALEYHHRHMVIAIELRDRVGESRACWSLGSAHRALQQPEQALHFVTRHLQLSKEIGDESGIQTAESSLADLQASLQTGAVGKPSCDVIDGSQASAFKRRSMEKLDLVKLSPDKAVEETSRPLVKSATLAGLDTSASGDAAADKLWASDQRGRRDGFESEGFFELLDRFQSRRLNEQRCSFRNTDSRRVESQPQLNANSPCGADQLMDLVARSQGNRLNEQRASGPDGPQFPGLRANRQTIGQLLQSERGDGLPDEDGFFEMIMRAQGSRIEEQRSQLPTVSMSPARAPTVPDEDLFSLIQRVQSSRLEEQRSSLPVRDGGRVEAAPPVLVSKKKKKK